MIIKQQFQSKFRSISKCYVFLSNWKIYNIYSNQDTFQAGPLLNLIKASLVHNVLSPTKFYENTPFTF